MAKFYLKKFYTLLREKKVIEKKKDRSMSFLKSTMVHGVYYGSTLRFLWICQLHSACSVVYHALMCVCTMMYMYSTLELAAS